MAESVWITLEDPDEYEGITQRRPGAATASGSVRDQRAVVGPILRGIEAMQWGALAIAGFLVVAALLLVANTIRLAALRAPQGDRHHAAGGRLHALHRAAVPAGGAGDRADRRRPGRRRDGGASCTSASAAVCEDFVGFIPWVGLPEFLNALLVIAVLGPVLTLVPTLVLTRKYLKV